ncbi:LysR family transcriptional regulator [Luteimonas sp. SX5]|uniref:LysR family transcriptional regulator n=1 Tax=Luteimonas galliterrae TaxID=2940486 RepID=A0ABT0MIL5_9GAMM|nr:LysR family transcriptional regulator [Luteimonas galliterrae]MCL1634713.1 LysR family transcriptional regulator [Luteimonas galliterrae]
MDKLAAMRTFVRIVEDGSLTAAAESLDTSLPTVVRSLAALERHLGVSLLKRTTRRINLTDEGVQYLERCRDILAATQEAEDILVARRTEPVGKLSVTASVAFGRHYIAPIVHDFLRRHPKVSADMLFVDRVVNLIEEGMDVAVRIAHLRDSSLVAIPVGRVRRVLCASDRYLRRHGVPKVPADLREHNCVRHVGLNPRSEWRFRVGNRQTSVPTSSVVTCNEIDSALEACANGLGVGMFLSYMVAPYRKDGRLKYLLESYETEPIPVQVIYPQTRMLSNKVRTFVDECVDKLRLVAFD